STSASAIWSVFVAAIFGVGKGASWLFHGVRPLRIAAFVFIIIVGGALVYINTLGAWERTKDIGYATIIFGIEGIVLVALPIIFAVRGWFNTPVAIAIFASGIAIASFNAKPALENILTNDEGVVDPEERLAQAESLEQEVYGFLNPETGERMSETGLLFLVTRQEEDASRARTENGYVTASTKVDAEAAARRTEINQKLQQAETFRAQAAASAETSQLAIITFVVAELIRSFGLKVLVGFDPDGTGREEPKSSKPKRKGWVRAACTGLWDWLFGPGEPSDRGKAIYTEEEMLAKARQVAGGLKAAETRAARQSGQYVTQAGTRSDPHRAQYWSEAVAEMIAFRREKMPKAAFSFLVEKFGAGRTAPEFTSGLGDAVKRGWVSQEDCDRLLQVPVVKNGGPAPDDMPPPETGDENADDVRSDQPN
ncbi:MAG: hypothetical protein AAGJ50_09415, partial [Pseudomonadota bacterium]